MNSLILTVIICSLGFVRSQSNTVRRRSMAKRLRNRPLNNSELWSEVPNYIASPKLPPEPCGLLMLDDVDNLLMDPDGISNDYPGYDGWYNNLGQPELGAVDTPLLRYLPADYGDNVFKPRFRHRSGRERPNPLDLSEKLFKGPSGTKSQTGKNVLMVFFGQHVINEIVDAQRPACPPEYINIPIPTNHSYLKIHTEMPVLRTRYDERTGQSPNNPRQQLNEATPFLDGGTIYGTSKVWCDYLRRDVDGKLVGGGLLASAFNGSQPVINTIGLPMANPPPPSLGNIEQHEAQPVTRFFKLGSSRGNENPFLLSIGVVWFRWHNKLAKAIKRKNPHYSDEKVFNEARKWVIASQQSIIVYDWLPQWLNRHLSEYKGYNPSVNPQVEQMFESAASRFGHTLVPAGVYLREGGKDCRLNDLPIRTCNSYWLPQNSRWNSSWSFGVFDVERLLMGMVAQLAEKEDHVIVDDLRESFYGPLEFSRRDLMALNIQRGRDHGVPDYNSARTFYRLARITNFSDFRTGEDIVNKLRQLYNDTSDDIDLWVGGILQTKDGPDELFTEIIVDQLERIRNGDRYWFENRRNGLFTGDQIGKLRNLTFRTIILAVTKQYSLSKLDMPENVFKVPESNDEIDESCLRSNFSAPILVAGSCQFWNGTPIPCWHVPPVDANGTEGCTPLQTYDYFESSEWAFLLTLCFVGLFFPLLFFILLAKLKRLKRASSVKLRARLSKLPSAEDAASTFGAHEWIGFSKSSKPVVVCLKRAKKQIQIKNHLGFLTRAMDFSIYKNMIMFVPHESPYMMIRVDHNYDLVLNFESQVLRRAFVAGLEKFLLDIDVQRETVARITTFAVLKQAVTAEVRQRKLEQFFRVVFAQAFDITHCEEEMLNIDSTVAKDVIYTELTIVEFAEALSMRPDSEFVRKIFSVIDTDRNGFISFREFIDMLVLFLKGTADDKLKLMFNMYDINGVGYLKREDFASMLRSFMDTVNADVCNDELESLIHSMMNGAHIAKRETIDLQDFKSILGVFSDKLNYAELEFSVGSRGTSKKLHAGRRKIRSKFIGEVKKTVEGLYADPNDLRMRVEGPKDYDDVSNCADIVDKNANNSGPEHPWVMHIADKQLEIFWGFLCTVTLWVLFVQQFYYFSILREHTGLRRIMGLGLSVTRGATSAMMFAYSFALLTLCHNTITLLRDTVLQFYIPFDAAIEAHKYVACWALFFTLIHIIGHAFNFYHISTQTPDDLTCLFRNYFHGTYKPPKFQDWVWGTLTGITGILLTLVTGTMFIFSIPIIRRKMYKWFECSHYIYPAFYVLIFMHGSGRLIQEPHFHYFFLGPAILFTIDKIFTITRKTVATPLLKAEFLPSDVICLIFHRPLHFQYKAGQWVRISCPELNTSAYHPFTLSSAPHEPVLSVHIRTQGPWATNFRIKLDIIRGDFSRLPKIYVDGPYGESYQNWSKYSVSIMIGSGIGATYFASILKDIVHKSNLNFNLETEKVYFIWVTKSQKQFEWMVDIIREVEKTDVNHIVSVHIFITQFYQKFDLRTILLYICERHFQKISNKSLFTGLKAVTHFGRPNFSELFMAIQRIHQTSNTVGVFSCGAPTVTRAVASACHKLNCQMDSQMLFRHHFKNL